MFHSIALIKLVGLLAHLLTHKLLPIGYSGQPWSQGGGSLTPPPDSEGRGAPPGRRLRQGLGPPVIMVNRRTGWTGRWVKVKGREEKEVSVVADMGYGTVMVDWRDSNGLEEVSVTEIEEVSNSSSSSSLWFRRPHGGRFRRAEEERSSGEDLQPGRVLLNRFLKQFISSGNVSMVRKVLKDGADPNCTMTKGGKPALFAAAESEKSTDGSLVHALVEFGAEVNFSSPAHGGSALHAASRAGNIGAVKALLAQGAATHLTDLQGQTPLQCTENEEIRKVLEGEISEHEREAMMPRNTIDFSDQARNEGLYEMLKILLQRFPSAPSSLATIWLALMARVYSAVQTESFKTEDHRMISSILEDMITQKSKDLGTLICALKLLLDAVLRFPEHYISALHRCGALSVLRDLEKQYSSSIDVLSEDSTVSDDLPPRFPELVLLARSVLEQCAATRALASTLSDHMDAMTKLGVAIREGGAREALQDLGTMLVSSQGITPHEFITAGLAQALESFLQQTGKDGWSCLKKAMRDAEERSNESDVLPFNELLPSAKPGVLEKLIYLVHSTLDARMFTLPAHEVDLDDSSPYPHSGFPFGAAGSLAHRSREGSRSTLSALLRPVTLEMVLPEYGDTCRFKDTKKRIIVVKVQPLTRLGQLEETLFQSLLVTHPEYIQYCQARVGGHVQFRQGLSWGPLWHVVGFDNESGLHLIHNECSGNMEQVILATKKYRALANGENTQAQELLFQSLPSPREESTSQAKQEEKGEEERKTLSEVLSGPNSGPNPLGVPDTDQKECKTPSRLRDDKPDPDIEDLTQTVPQRRSAFLTPSIKQSMKSFLTIPRDKPDRDRERFALLTDRASKGGAVQENKDNNLGRSPKLPLSARGPREPEETSSKPSWLQGRKFMKQRSFGSIVNKFKERNPLSRRSPSPELNRDQKSDGAAFAVEDRVEAQFQMPDGDWTTAWYGGVVKSVEKNHYSIVFDDGDQQSGIPQTRVRTMGTTPGVGSIVRVMWPREGGLPLRACVTKVHNDGTSCAVAYEDGDYEEFVSLSRILTLNEQQSFSEVSSIRHNSSADDSMRRAWVRVEGTPYWRPALCVDAAHEVGLNGIYNAATNAGMFQVCEDDMVDIAETLSPSTSKMASIAHRIFGRRSLRSEALNRQHDEMRSHLENLRARLSRHRNRHATLGSEPSDEPELPSLDQTLSALADPHRGAMMGSEEEEEEDDSQFPREPDEEMVAASITDDEAQPEEWITPPTLRLALAKVEKFPSSSDGQAAEGAPSSSSSEPNWSLFEEEDSLVKCLAGLQGRCMHNDEDAAMTMRARRLTTSQNVTHLLFKVVMDSDGIDSTVAPRTAWQRYFDDLSKDQQRSLRLLYWMWTHGMKAQEGSIAEDDPSGTADTVKGFDFDITNQRLPMWSNVKLCEALTILLSDGVAVASGALPAWADGLLCRFPFLVGPLSLRWRYFQASSLGVSRSLLVLQQASQPDPQSTNATENPVRERQLFGQLKKEVIQVSKERLLRSAEKIMKVYSKKKVALEFRFIGEKGMGSGVTASFYSALAEKLLERETNVYWRLWLDEDSSKGSEGYLSHPNGLFPKPLPAEDFLREEVIEKFRFLGRLVGRAFLDSQTFPLPFSVDFLTLVLQKGLNSLKPTECTENAEQAEEEYWLNTYALSRVFLQPGAVLFDLMKASQRLEQVQNNVELSEKEKADSISKITVGDTSLPIEEWLSLSNLSMVDPVTGFELIAGGELTEVTLDNLVFYTKRLADSWLGNGIKEQVLEFQRGIDEVLPIHKLKLFFPKELGVLIGGERDLDWDSNYLESTVIPSHGYTSNSAPYKWVLEALVEMAAADKKQFLLFVTGCPTSPPGGLSRLTPPLEIIRRQNPSGASGSADYDLPFARTCTNTLHLPPYSSKEILVEKLQFVMSNSTSIIDRD